MSVRRLLALAVAVPVLAVTTASSCTSTAGTSAQPASPTPAGTPSTPLPSFPDAAGLDGVTVTALPARARGAVTVEFGDGLTGTLKSGRRYTLTARFLAGAPAGTVYVVSLAATNGRLTCPEPFRARGGRTYTVTCTLTPEAGSGLVTARADELTGPFEYSHLLRFRA
jgi:hypothetical protein